MPRLPPEGTTPNGSPEKVLEIGVREGERIIRGWVNEILKAVGGLGTFSDIQRAIDREADQLDVRQLSDSIQRQDLRAQMLGAADAEWEAVNAKIVKPTRFARGVLGSGRPIRGRPFTLFVQKPFGPAVADFLARQVVTRDVFDRMAKDARRRAFTVAGAAKLSMVEVVNEELANALMRGEDLRQFRARLKERMELSGWLKPGPKKEVPTRPGRPWHVETIYRTNVAGSYARGRRHQMTQPAVVAVRPYWQIVTLKADGKSRKTHAAAHGKILRWDDPFWERAGPPFGFNCFLPGTLVQGRFIGASRARYSGPVVELVISTGRKLTVTAGHPVMTRGGLKRASSVRVGDELLCYDREGGAFAEQAFKAVAGARDPVAMAMLPERFHGEAALFEGEVALVGSYADQDIQPIEFGPAAAMRARLPHGPLRRRPSMAHISFGKVVSAEMRGYQGTVFDFETRTGWLVAEGVFASNCRCRAVSRSAVDVERQGLSVTDGSTMTDLPDKGWDAGTAMPAPAIEPPPPPRPKPAPPKPPAPPPKPKRAPRKRKVNVGEMLGDGELVGRPEPISTDLSGINTSLVVRMRDAAGREVQGVFKPISGETFELRQHIRTGTFYRREVVASKFDDMLRGTEAVPKTVKREVGGELGSVQHYRTKAIPTHKLTAKQLADLTPGNVGANPSVRKTFLHDVVLGNTDRHHGNIMWEVADDMPGGLRAVAIDNGLTLPRDWSANFRWPKFMGGDPYLAKLGQLDQESVAALARLKRTKLAKMLADEGIEKEAARAAMVRAEALKANPRAIIDPFRVGDDDTTDMIGKINVFWHRSHYRPQDLLPPATVKKIDRALDTAYR